MGAVTFLGGLPLAEPVIEAMRAAAGQKVDLNELNVAAGRRIAELTGAEAAFVTTGAAAGLQLAAAACLTGSDVARIARVPEIRGERSRIVIHRKHRCNFDHAIRATGARLVEFGYSRDRTELWELEDALDDQTAAVAYIANFSDGSVLSLEQVVAAAHEREIPVFVDTAVSLPPASNLRDIPATGADLCCFSGGKAVGGPQNTGFIVGRADLVAACSLNANPNHNTIGRPLKVNAESVAGLLAALEDYVVRDHDADARRWREVLERVRELAGLSDDEAGWRIADSSHRMPIPSLHVRIPGGADAAAAAASVLSDGDPAVWVGVEADELVVNPHALMPEDVGLVGERLGALVSGILPAEGRHGGG
jgi:L-seryl-tRNA(Ser) seleniumtransferase